MCYKKDTGLKTCFFMQSKREVIKTFEAVTIPSGIPPEERENKMQKWINYFCFDSETNTNDNEKLTKQ